MRRRRLGSCLLKVEVTQRGPVMTMMAIMTPHGTLRITTLLPGLQTKQRRMGTSGTAVRWAAAVEKMKLGCSKEETFTAASRTAPWARVTMTTTDLGLIAAAAHETRVVIGTKKGSG
jgi:hypothetical protein